MSGKVKQLIDAIVAHRSRGNPTMAGFVRAKLMLKGIDPAQYTDTSPDDPAVVRKLEALARELGVEPSGPGAGVSWRPPPSSGNHHR
ncbi:hypothetical protein [Polyangium spumosum]|uniref:hypothetical protein n=1 Tax=Polyangium spumosum TaxID=889282 RepID=UPI00197E8DEC|nr:hypothetical protein [Polyangium spumosum]